MPNNGMWLNSCEQRRVAYFTLTSVVRMSAGACVHMHVRRTSDRTSYMSRLCSGVHACVGRLSTPKHVPPRDRRRAVTRRGLFTTYERLTKPAQVPVNGSITEQWEGVRWPRRSPARSANPSRDRPGVCRTSWRAAAALLWTGPDSWASAASWSPMTCAAVPRDGPMTSIRHSQI